MCRICRDYGYVQVCWSGRVMRVYCDCEAGTKRIEEVKEALREVGLDPDSPSYRYYRYSDVPRL